MANRNFNWRPSWLTATLGVAVGMVIAGTVVLTPMPAQAVHDGTGTFELDGDATDESTLDDWDSAFEFGSPPYPTIRLQPTRGPGETFVEDSHDPDDTAFSQSNKDIHEVNSWTYNTKGISPPKDDITNAYAKASMVPGYPASDLPGHPASVHEHLVVYFGADRFADDGDAAMGFWFFRNDVGLDGNGKFEGTHAVGDILIQVDYRGAGDNEIEVFKWIGGKNPLQRLVIGTSSNPADTICNEANGFPADSACITTNIVEEDSPWAYVGKDEDNVGPNRFPARVFMEGGFDVSALVGNVCFSEFMAETRSSHSETAALKDFALGSFDLCSINLERKYCVEDDDAPATDVAGGVSPLYNPTTEKFETTHIVQIANDGFGSVSNVRLIDTAVSTNNVCTIIDIEGVPDNRTFANNSTALTVFAGTFLPGDELTVTLRCTSVSDNPFINAVTVEATSGGGSTVSDSYDEADDPADYEDCQVTLNPSLSIDKFCSSNPSSPDLGSNQGTMLLPPSFAPQVCVDVKVTNTSSPAQKIDVLTLTDDENGPILTSEENILAAFETANKANGTGDATNGVRMEPGEIVSFQRCYNPAKPDEGYVTTPVAISPCDAGYSDTVYITAEGVTAGTIGDPNDPNNPRPSSTVRCLLCDCDP